MVLAAAALWGALGVLAREAYLRGATPLETASARAALAFLALGAIHAFRPRRLGLPVRSLPLLALFGAVGIALFYWLYLAAIEVLAVGVAAALLYTAPVFAVLLARPLLGEPLTARKLVALVAAVGGVGLVSGLAAARGSVPAGAPGAGEPGMGGILLGLGAGLAYALFTLIGKRASSRHDAVRIVFWAMGFGAVCLAFVVPPWRVLLEHPSAVPWVLALALLSTLVANLLYIGALARLEAGVAALLATIEPVVAALLGWLWLGEVLDGGQLAGLALVVGAAALLLGGGGPEGKPDRSQLPRISAR